MKIIGKYACCAGLGLISVLPSSAQSSKKNASLDGKQLIASAGNQPFRFTLEGTLKDLPVQPAKLYLVYDTLSGKPADSAVVVNGKYKFTGMINEPVIATITPKPFNSRNNMEKRPDYENMATVFLDKGNIKATSTTFIHNMKVTGSAASDAFKTANRTMDMMQDSAQDIARLYRETQDRFYFDQVMMKAMSMQRPMIDAYIGFMQKHPASSVNPYLVNALVDYLPKGSPGAADTVFAIYNRMPAAMKESVTGKTARERLNKEMKIAIGHKAPAFSLQNAKGETISLDGLKGKYVLVFFQYAGEKSSEESWLASVFQSYKDKNLAMVCIAVKTDKQVWDTEMQTRNTPWMNAWDGNGDVEAQYNISGTRSNLLLDPVGNIIARNLNGSDIQRTLSDVLD